MAPPDTIWHKESLKLKEIFGTREGFEICPNNFSPRPNFSPPCNVQLTSSQPPVDLQPISVSSGQSPAHSVRLRCRLNVITNTVRML